MIDRFYHNFHVHSHKITFDLICMVIIKVDIVYNKTNKRYIAYFENQKRR